MKCKYCGKKTAGSAAYCSTYCRQKGEAREQFGRKTRLPFIISLVLAVVAAGSPWQGSGCSPSRAAERAQTPSAMSGARCFSRWLSRSSCSGGNQPWSLSSSNRSCKTRGEYSRVRRPLNWRTRLPFMMLCGSALRKMVMHISSSLILRRRIRHSRSCR